MSKKKKERKKLKKLGITITKVDPHTAMAFLNIKLDSKNLIIQKLLKRTSALQIGIHEAEVALERNLVTIKSLHEQLDLEREEHAEITMANAEASDDRLRTAIQAVIEGESKFLENLLLAANSVTAKSNKDPLIAALQAVREIAEERLSEIKISINTGDESGADKE